MIMCTVLSARHISARCTCGKQVNVYTTLCNFLHNKEFEESFIIFISQSPKIHSLSPTFLSLSLSLPLSHSPFLLPSPSLSTLPPFLTCLSPSLSLPHLPSLPSLSLSLPNSAFTSSPPPLSLSFSLNLSLPPLSLFLFLSSLSMVLRYGSRKFPKSRYIIMHTRVLSSYGIQHTEK